MKKEKISYFISLIFFSLGMFFIVNSSWSITGAVLEVPVRVSDNILVGFGFLGLAEITNLAGDSNSRPRVISRIKKYPRLAALTEQACRNDEIQRGINNLENELYKGNLTAGLRHQGHLIGTDVDYLRERHGARLYYRIYHNDKNDEDMIEIVAKSGKGKNQDSVINILRKKYEK